MAQAPISYWMHGEREKSKNHVDLVQQYAHNRKKTRENSSVEVVFNDGSADCQT